jgi:transcriptional regulator with XRE-family HTH domain
MRTGQLASRFGAVLRELRIAAGLTQEGLAAQCDLDRTYVSLLERGLRQPTLTTIFTLAAQLGTKPSAIIGRVENPRQG